jgi:hypothetical protein
MVAPSGLALALVTVLCALLTIAPVASAQAAARSPTPRLLPTDTTNQNDTDLRLRIDAMSPRVVTATGPAALTVTGSLLNAGTQPIRNLEVRAQLSERLRTEADIRTALAGDAQDDAVTPTFTELAAELPPGGRIPVHLSVDLRGPATTSLAITHRGVYQLLINVNGIPAGGDQARLTGARVLLPVLAPPSPPGSPATPAPPATGPPRQVNILYPIADQPRRLPTGPGEPVLLGDDELARELAKGGRLDALLAGLDAAPPGSPVREAICLAVDPDLIRTVSDMTAGYQVRQPDGSQRPGRGAADAKSWLNRLRASAAGRCVIALPYADADLVALSRAGLDGLTGYATSTGAKVLTGLLGTPVRTDTTWPADSVLDERSLGAYNKAGGRAVVLSADAVTGIGRAANRNFTGGTVRLTTPGASSTGLLTDPLVSQAGLGPAAERGELSGTAGGFAAELSGTLSDSDQLSPANRGGTLSAQDMIGAIGYGAMNSASASRQPLLIAPPHRWDVTASDAAELISGVATLAAASELAPVPVPTGDAQDGTGASLVYPLRAGAREIPTAVTARLRADQDMADNLRAAATPAQGVGTTPAQVFDPVTEGLLRAASATWRGRPQLSRAATKVITARVALLRSLVRVIEPGTPYALGAKNAPLPITLINGLPVAMRVKVVMSYTPGLKVSAFTPDPVQHPIPPLGRLQLRADTELTRSGQFSVEAYLTTVTGVRLGLPSRLVLRSTAYGTITLWLTGTAFLLLVILAVRRIARRVRAARRNGPPDGAAASAGRGTPTSPITPPRGRHPPDRASRTARHPRDPVPRRLGAAAREEDEAALRQSHSEQLAPDAGLDPGLESGPDRRIGRTFVENAVPTASINSPTRPIMNPMRPEPIVPPPGANRVPRKPGPPPGTPPMHPTHPAAGTPRVRPPGPATPIRPNDSTDSTNRIPRGDSTNRPGPPGRTRSTGPGPSARPVEPARPNLPAGQGGLPRSPGPNRPSGLPGPDQPTIPPPQPNATRPPARPSDPERPNEPTNPERTGPTGPTGPTAASQPDPAPAGPNRPKRNRPGPDQTFPVPPPRR